MKIQVGGYIAGFVDTRGDIVKFLADDGQTLFEVRTKGSGTSIEIRAVDCCMVNGVMRDTSLEIRPHVTNCITVGVGVYGK